MATAHYPPGPRSWFPGGQLLAFFRDPIALFTQLARDYGDVVAFTLGGERAFFFNHPDYVREILVNQQRNFTKGRALRGARHVLGEGLITSEGDFHLRQRRLAQPAFQRRRIASYAAIMVEYSNRMQQRWHDGERLDMLHEMTRLTLAILAKTLFNADVEREARDVEAALYSLLQAHPKALLPLGRFLRKLPLPSNRRAAYALQFLDSLIYSMIAERRRSGEDTGDLLSMLLLARDAEGDGSGMTDQQVRDEAMTLFLAGHETAANMLTWTWYVLSQHPDVEATLHAELHAVLGGRLPTAEDVPRLPYTRMVLAESLRLYPPVWLTGRRSVNDFAVAGYTIPGQSLIFLSPYVLHHDPRYFAHPERFEPQRWAHAAETTRQRLAYFPFGAGVRQCIGESFACMEGVLMLAIVAQQWQPRLVPEHPVALRPLITLRPKYGMRMTMIKRPNAPQAVVAGNS